MSVEANPAPSKIIPNTFQTPNALTDEVMRLLSGNEVKCYLVIVRKTFGWNKRSDRIPKSQIIDLTGLGENAVEDCLAVLVEYGLVVRLAENNPAQNWGVEWALQLDERLIRWSDLEIRAKSIKAAKAESAALARLKRGGVDGQTDNDGQPEGGVDRHTTQKPLSKANKEEERKAPQKSKIFQTYEQEFGALTPLIADAIADAERDFPEPWILEAMQIAVERNARNWKYVRAVLEDAAAKKMSPKLNNQSKQKGKSNDKPTKPNSKPVENQSKPRTSTVDEINRRRRQKSLR